MNCILCDWEYKKYISWFDNTHTATRDQFEILKCVMCGLEKTIIDANQLWKYYPKDYYSYTWWLNGMERIIRNWYNSFQNRKFNFLKYVFYGKLIKYPCGLWWWNFLDIWCWNNSHFKFLSTYWWDCSGFEVGKWWWVNNIFYAPNILTFDSDKTYDRITLRHVLEHFDRPTEYMLKISSLMNNDSKLVISVPNQDSWYAKLFWSYWYNRDTPRHLYNWSPKTLSILWTWAWLKIDKIYHQSLFSWANSLLLLFKYKLWYSDKLISILRPLLYFIFYPFDLLSNLLRKWDVITVIFFKS